MKRLLSVLVLLLILVGAGLWYWTTTPQYAMQQAGEAMKAHDVQKFHQWVDVQSVSSSAVDDLLAEPVVKSGGAGVLERVIGFGVVSILKPTVVESMSHQVDHLVQRPPTSGSDASQAGKGNAQASSDDEDAPVEQPQPKSVLFKIIAVIKPPSLRQVLRDAGYTRKNYRGTSLIDSSDHLAHMGVRFYIPKKEKESVIEVELAKSSGRWQVTRISNLQKVLISGAL